MTPSIEMIKAYFDELSHFNREDEWIWFEYGIAAYCHLSSPASDDWKRQHGFPTSDEKGGEQ